MEPAEAADPALLSRYEGLVRKTSSLCVEQGLRGKDFDEICQVFRMKVWSALLAFNPKSAIALKRRREGKSIDKQMDSFVFGAVYNQKRDLFKRNPEGTLLIDDIADTEPAQERFIFRYMMADEDQVFGAAEESDPLVPNTLTYDERRVLACAYLGHNGPQTAKRLDLSRSQVAAALRGIREKMRDWKPPGAVEPEPSEMSPTPVPAA